MGPLAQDSPVIFLKKSVAQKAVQPWSWKAGNDRRRSDLPSFFCACCSCLPGRLLPGEWMERTTLRARTGPGVSALRDSEAERQGRHSRRDRTAPGNRTGPPGTAGQRKRFWSSATGTGPALCWKKGGAPGEKRAPGMKAGRDDAGSRRGAAAEDHDRIRKKGRRARDCCRSGNLELSLVFCARQQKYNVAQSS